MKQVKELFMRFKHFNGSNGISLILLSIFIKPTMNEGQVSAGLISVHCVLNIF